jgi:hypothetical protein
VIAFLVAARNAVGRAAAGVAALLVASRPAFVALGAHLASSRRP